MPVNLREPWSIGGVEVPTRIVLAPMAGVSIQAFRRQGRRFGAGLVCSEMVSAAGIEHRNERTFGYLRVAADEHPLAIQIFGSEPRAMAEAARMVEAAGADIVDMNFGCPVRKVTKTGAGAHLMEDPELACRVVSAVAGAVARSGHGEDASRRRERLARVPRARAAARRGGRGGADAPSPLRAQMYTGVADHSLTAELVERVPVPVIASGDVTTREEAIAVLERTGAAAAMVARGAQGNPWALREMIEGESFTPTREEVAAELIVFIREAVRELGEQRAVGFLKKFYGWYLGHGRFPKPFKQEIVMLRTTRRGRDAAVRRGSGRGGARRAARGRAAGGGGRRRPRAADLGLRRRLNRPVFQVTDCYLEVRVSQQPSRFAECEPRSRTDTVRASNRLLLAKSGSAPRRCGGPRG